MKIKYSEKECDKSRLVAEYSLGRRMIGAFNRLTFVAIRRQLAFVTRFGYWHWEYNNRLRLLSQSILVRVLSFFALYSFPIT